MERVSIWRLHELKRKEARARDKAELAKLKEENEVLWKENLDWRRWYEKTWHVYSHWDCHEYSHLTTSHHRSTVPSEGHCNHDEELAQVTARDTTGHVLQCLMPVPAAVEGRDEHCNTRDKEAERDAVFMDVADEHAGKITGLQLRHLESYRFEPCRFRYCRH